MKKEEKDFKKILIERESRFDIIKSLFSCLEDIEERSLRYRDSQSETINTTISNEDTAPDWMYEELARYNADIEQVRIMKDKLLELI